MKILCVPILLLLLAASASVARAQDSERFFHSEVFRDLASGTSSVISTQELRRQIGSTPQEVFVSFQDPDTLSLGSSSLSDEFAVSGSSFCDRVGLFYWATGTASGGPSNVANSQLQQNRQEYQVLKSRSAHATQYVEVVFFLRDSSARLAQAVCETREPCTGDVTPFVSFPENRFVPPHYYPNHLHLESARGIEWSNDKVETRSVFEQQPAVAYSTFGGRVVSVQLKLSLAFLRSLKSATAAECKCAHAGIPLPREFETGGWYPTRYSVQWDEATRRYTVAASDLQFFDAFADKLGALQRRENECAVYKSSLEALVKAPKSDKVIINHRFAGMLNQ